MDTQGEKQERFILNCNAGVGFQGMVVYKITKADGKIEIKKHDGTIITDKKILAEFDNLATPY